MTLIKSRSNWKKKSWKTLNTFFRRLILYWFNSILVTTERKKKTPNFFQFSIDNNYPIKQSDYVNNMISSRLRVMSSLFVWSYLLLFKQGCCSSVQSVSPIPVSLSLSQFDSFLSEVNNFESDSCFVISLTSPWRVVFSLDGDGCFTELRFGDKNVRVVLKLPVQFWERRCQTFLSSVWTFQIKRYVKWVSNW